MLSLKKIALSNEGQTIFTNLSVTFLPSAIVTLQGNNGTGKTSLLRIIAGLQKPTRGCISYGKDNLPLSEFLKPYCTYIGHKNGFKQELSVFENLIFAAKIYNAKELVEAAIHYFTLESVLDKQYYQLSAGNQQKVALARLMVCPTKLWLLDEVEASLDENNRQKLRNLITIQANNGGIIISTSHHENWLKNSVKINLEDFVK